MKHLFVPYSIAVMAKEAGFEEQCFAYYSEHKELVTLHLLGNSLFPERNEIAAPLYQQLVDFWRNKGLHININQDIKIATGKWYYTISYNYIIGYFEHSINGNEREYSDYYQALDEALSETFKLI